jgi:hypothetical protein
MPQNIPHRVPDSTPDFRHMTPQDLRRGLTTLNALVRDLKRFHRTGQPRCLAEWREGTPGAAQAAAVLPSAGLVTRLAELPVPLEAIGTSLLGRDLVTEAETLRKKYKDVWRARPRETVRDISSRLKRKPTGWSFGRKP